MKLIPRIKGRTTSARTALLVFLVALMPSFFGVSRFILQLSFEEKLFGLKRGIIVRNFSFAEENAILLFAYSLLAVAIFSIIVFILLTSKQSISDKLEKRFGRFSLAWLFATVMGLAVFGATGLGFLSASRNIGAFVFFALCGLICATIGALISFRFKPVASYRPSIAVVPFLLGIAPLAYALFLTPSRVPNEFLALPSETIFSDGRHIDNIAFINSKRFEGLFIPDPRNSLTLAPPFSMKVGDRVDITIIKRLQESAPERLWYDQDANRLELHGQMTDDEYRQLLSIASEEEKELLSKKYVADITSSLELANRRYDKDEMEFLRLNREELERELVLGRFFYHHVFIFLPVLSGILDGEVRSASQYGRGFTEFFSLILKFSPENLRFNAYLALLYSSYPLYLCILAFIAVCMGLSRWAVTFVCAVALIGFLNSDIETIRLGVGLVPWRHFFDVVVLYCLFFYVRRPGVIAGLLITTLTGLSLYWSREMGSFLAIAAVFGMVLHALFSRQTGQWIQVGAYCLVSSLCYWLGNPNAATHVTALFLGINTPALPAGFVQLLAGVELVAGALWWSRAPTTPSREVKQYADWIFLGSALVYITICGVYLLWYPKPHHLAPTVPVIGLAMAIAYRHYFSDVRKDNLKVGGVIIALTLLVLTFVGSLRLLDLRGEERVFRNHVVHKWNFPNGQLTSTGQPGLIDESIGLIRKYGEHSSANILSPWEVVLLPFAGKYKAGPFMITFDALLSSNEINKSAEQIVSSLDRVVLVDTRIIHGQYELPLLAAAYMDNRITASVSRLGSHAGLRRVFELIRPCYELVEEGRLISVYVRKPSAMWKAGVCTLNS